MAGTRPTNDRRAALDARIHRLKLLVVGITAAAAATGWWFVSGDVARTAAATAQAGTSTPAPSTDHQSGDDGFFGGGSTLGDPGGSTFSDPGAGFGNGGGFAHVRSGGS